MEGLKVGWKKEGVEGKWYPQEKEMRSDWNLIRKKKCVSIYSEISEEEKEISMTIEVYIIWEQEFFTKLTMLFL